MINASTTKDSITGPTIFKYPPSLLLKAKMINMKPNIPVMIAEKNRNIRMGTIIPSGEAGAKK
jgi:hypothetical protein